ncbi:hypothetical protein HRI_000969700 [Hibiscus trionum]|uniref:Uncharacterized protein n=1 Tax=Hibiscus trionum TaxID=183268 RepID=A0A9W7H8N8_HIBTR|nr:hypothetical protein HRI_000969700 [Hibiscus trionum]
MSKSPKYEASDYDSREFDPRLNFSQFLEEARQHAGGDTRVNFQRSSSSCSKQVGEIKLGGGHKKNKKLWKISFFSSWKFDRKNKSSSDPAQVSKPTKGCGYGSGPLRRTAEGIDTVRRRASSGPISILFNPSKKVENEVPYMCLGQPNDPYQINAYGPVYLVT